MIHRSPYPDVDVPDVSLTEYVLGGAHAHGDKPALIDGLTGETTTYAALLSRVRGAAARMAADGIGPGDVVGLLAPNLPSWPVAYHAIASLGAVVTPLNPILTADEIAKQLDDAGAGAVVAAGPLLQLVRDRDARVYELDELASADGGHGELLTRAVTPDEDLAVLPFSSGTTGVSKGVMLTHRNLVANMEQIRSIHRIGPDDVLVGVLPFFHIYGQTVVLNLGLAQGATIVTLPRFDFQRFLGILQEHRVTRAHIAPPVVLALANVPIVDDYDYSSLRILISGAAPLDEDLALRAGERIGAPVRQGYGMTEASPVTHIASDDDLGAISPGTVGFLAPNTEARLVDTASGEDSPDEGELLIRGPQVMRGYLANREATAASLTEDGWLRTGDVARVDADGSFRIVDRVKELIKYKGYQVPPAELEALLVGHPGVADAAVIGIPDAEGGEAPKACVVPRGELDPDELMRWVAERVAPYKRIRSVEVLDEIPKSASGKILRRVLVERERERGRG